MTTPDRSRSRDRSERKNTRLSARRALIRRSPLLLLMIALAVISGTAAFSLSVGRRAPTLAIGLWPPSGDAYSRASSQFAALAMVDPKARETPALNRNAERLARRALELEPTSVSAIRNIGMALAERDRVAARRLMLLGANLSRRNGALNLWLSDDFARRGDDQAAMRYFDATMRTNSSAANAILPTLATALRRPGAPAAFETAFADDPQWHDEFWTAVLSQPGDLSNAVDLRMRLHRRKIPMESSHDALLIEHLANSGRVVDAFRLYALAAPGSARPAGELLANTEFDAESKFAPIDWKIAPGSNHSSELDTKRGRLAISAIGGASGALAQQLVPFRSGRYQVDVRYAGEASGAMPLQLRIACAELAGEGTLNRVLPIGRSGVQVATFETPCRYAWVSLEIVGRSDGSGFDTTLDRVSIRRMG